MSYSFQLLSLVLAILFISLFAQLSIDLPVGQTMLPITGQTFAVLVVGYVLGAVWGTLAVLLYVLLGLLGLPIFADAKSGFEVLTGGSGGYLIGFIVGAWVVGYYKSAFQSASLLSALWLMTLGTAVILLFGVGRLMQLYGVEKGLDYGFYPFWPGAIVKIVLGAIVGYVVDRYKIF